MDRITYQLGWFNSVEKLLANLPDLGPQPGYEASSGHLVKTGQN